MFASTVKEIEPSELDQWLSDSNQKLRVIDVRQIQEIATGTVATAEALPLHTLQARIHELSPEEKLVIICRSGARSAQACMFLQQQGFTDVYNLRGGMIGWVQSGLPAHQP
ncbi:MAG: rhodanese-like domain-containing protein [Gallionellaceae bacterium]